MDAAGRRVDDSQDEQACMSGSSGSIMDALSIKSQNTGSSNSGRAILEQVDEDYHPIV